VVPKTCVITDIHGRLSELWFLLDLMPDGAKMIFLGDYIDRGSQSAEVVALMRLLQQDGAICLRGNHEDMMCNPDTMGGTWMANGGSATVESYRDPLSGDVNVGLMERDAAWFETLPRVHSDAHRVYVHAGVLPLEPLDNQPQAITQWFRYPNNVDVGWRDKHVVHGHTPGVLHLTNRTCLDGGKALCCGVFDDDVPGGPVEMLWA
jgi:serine/threonine protein phosphatase 1